MRIHTIDLDFQHVPRAIAAYLVEGPSGPVLVETGPGSTVETLARRLAERGYAPEDVLDVLVTHIHLDHAGAAGWWARKGARVHVHHVGAPHLIDPSKLLASARRIYGERMDPLWGEVLPAPADRVVPLDDGAVVEAGGLRFTAIDTPGHARHHMVYRLEDVAFTGDVAGIRMPGLDLVDLPAPPPEFDLDVWNASLNRLADEDFAALYPTHFGRVDLVGRHLDAVRSLLGEASGFVHGMLVMGADRDAMMRAYLAWGNGRMAGAGLERPDLALFETANPYEMSVDGIARYWRKRASES